MQINVNKGVTMADSAQMKKKVELPTDSWIRELQTRLALKKHFIVIHGNIRDKYCCHGKNLTMSEMLREVFASCDLILRFNIAEGLLFEKGEKKDFAKLAGIDVSIVSGDVVLSNPEMIFIYLKKIFGQKKQQIMIRFDYFGSLNRYPTAMIQLQNFLNDETIAQNGHTIIIESKNLFDIDQDLRQVSCGAAVVRASRPNCHERRRFIDDLMIPAVNTGDIGLEELKNLTSGLGYKQIAELIEHYYEKGETLRQEIFRLKADIQAAENGDIMEITKTQWGFDAFAGMEGVKERFLIIKKSMIKGDVRNVPMGVLFTGPPGTGKTALAEAFAKEVGFSFVKFKSVFNKWVGETESRMERFLTAVKDLAPVIVFIDEVDKCFSGSGENDGGVSDRVRQKFQTLLGDTTLRGKVLVLMATNYPERIDPELKRAGRCDLIIPFIPPLDDEILPIIKSVLAREKYEVKTKDEDLSGWASKLHDYSRAAIVEIIRRAFEHACLRDEDRALTLEDFNWAYGDFIPTKMDQRKIDAMTKLAIEGCSSRSLLPKNYDTILKDIERRELTGYKTEIKKAPEPETPREIPSVDNTGAIELD
jgi:transitional endoplasmic reticulum ATPase